MTHDATVKHQNSAKFSLLVEAVFLSLLKDVSFPLCEESVITSPAMVTMQVTGDSPQNLPPSKPVILLRAKTPFILDL